MIRVILFDLLLFGACGYALLRGRTDARIVAVVCIVANFASYAVVSRYAAVETGVLIIDLLTFLAFTAVALKSDRFWPLWVSGLQLTTSLGHVFKAIETDLMPLAYAAALRFWSYPILIILAVGVWRSQRRARAEQRAAHSG
jgi:hypothetical protein